MEPDFDLPQLYKAHVFACSTQRPPQHPRGSCGAKGAGVLLDRMVRQLDAARMPDLGFTPCGCLGFCNAGPLMVVYPDGVWYRPETVEDVDEIVEQHLKQGKWVERLVVVLSK